MAETHPIKSDGGSTSYYEIPEGASELNDLIEYKNMNFAQGNIFKACYRLGEKDGTDIIYDLKKIIFFANRLIKMEEKKAKNNNLHFGTREQNNDFANTISYFDNNGKRKILVSNTLNTEIISTNYFDTGSSQAVGPKFGYPPDILPNLDKDLYESLNETLSNSKIKTNFKE